MLKYEVSDQRHDFTLLKNFFLKSSVIFPNLFTTYQQVGFRRAHGPARTVHFL